MLSAVRAFRQEDDMICEQLETRYSMDKVIWQASQKKSFPFNVSVGTVFGICALGVLAAGLHPARNIFADYNLVACLASSTLLSIVAFYLADAGIREFKSKLEEKGLFGRDLNKIGDHRDESKEKIPEALGIIPAIIFLLTTIVMVLTNELVLRVNAHTKIEVQVEYNAALLSICLVVLLGFIDDVIDLRWRHKLIVPTIASVPILVAYKGLTSVVVPTLLRGLVGRQTFDLSFLYYVYMGMLAIFCTNSINIYAGLNGLEVGQSIIIGSFILMHNIIEMKLNEEDSTVYNQHQLSMTIVIPFLMTSVALMKHNVFPSRVFVGDTYCYFAGMTFAVVGILGHFSKTMLLLFIPQIINFVLSFPQLVGVIWCPRHRLPYFEEQNYKLECRHNHYTLINAFLRKTGPLNEQQACNTLLLQQVVCCALAFFIRYGIAEFFFQ